MDPRHLPLLFFYYTVLWKQVVQVFSPPFVEFQHVGFIYLSFQIISTNRDDGDELANGTYT